MAKNNKTCTVCGKKYSYCVNCYDDRLKPTYMNEFCSETCKDVFEIATRFNLNLITKSEAQSMLELLELKPTEQYTEMIQNDIKNIMAKPKMDIQSNKHEVVKTKEFNKAQ